ncbi:SIMPL domain-containing protein [Parvularcula dongshanensis]|uniref:Uncharacterized protein YggE n=1 Tax=Parvularcula dongshanensis TaxID=1173995 RepID=A0A840I4M8_9PROT|nr:SIMPL domain-containing protein [Parvularcula dongshanensis]MBB4658980.1 uncharacterized protein YggE [Parvularcula dongshanensis]
MLRVVSLWLFGLMLFGCGAPDEARSITIRASATAEATADTFVVNAAAMAGSRRRDEAIERLAAQIAAVRRDAARLEGLSALTVEAADLSIEGVPAATCVAAYEYDWERLCAPSEYRTRSALTLRGRPAALAGDMVSLLSELVSGDVALSGYELSDRTALEQEALRSAMASGRTRAALIAEASGDALGRLIDAQPLDDRGTGGDVIVVTGTRAGGRDRVSPRTPIALDPTVVREEATVRLTFAIE